MHWYCIKTPVVLCYVSWFVDVMLMLMHGGWRRREKGSFSYEKEPVDLYQDLNAAFISSRRFSLAMVGRCDNQ